MGLKAFSFVCDSVFLGQVSKSIWHFSYLLKKTAQRIMFPFSVPSLLLGSVGMCCSAFLKYRSSGYF